MIFLFGFIFALLKLGVAKCILILDCESCSEYAWVDFSNISERSVEMDFGLGSWMDVVVRFVVITCKYWVCMDAA